MEDDKLVLIESAEPGTKAVLPVFWAKTKSWWLAGFPAFLIFIDFLFQQLDSPEAVPFANAIALVLNLFGLDLTGEDVNGWLRGIAPFYVALTIMYQRRGINQPYVATPAKEKAVKELVYDGMAAFDRGKLIGKAIKR